MTNQTALRPYNLFPRILVAALVSACLGIALYALFSVIHPMSVLHATFIAASTSTITLATLGYRLWEKWGQGKMGSKNGVRTSPKTGSEPEESPRNININQKDK